MDKVTQHDNPNGGWLRASRGAVLCLEIDLRAQAFINIDLMEGCHSWIPLHLSLRRDAGILIANQFGPNGWRRELVIATGLLPRNYSLHIGFEDDLLGKASASIWLDGRHLARLDSYPRFDPGSPKGIRRGFPHLKQIASVNWPAGVCSIRYFRPEMLREPLLTERLELLWRAPNDHAVLELADEDEPMEFLPLSSAEPPQLEDLQHVLLPGRIWKEAQDEVTGVTVRAGTTRLRVKVHKSTLLDRLSSPQALLQMQHDRLIRMHMIEHAHHAAIWDRLPDPVRNVLASEARQIGITFAHECRRTALAPPPEKGQTTAAEVCDLFHEKIALSPSTDAISLLDDLIKQHGLDCERVRQLALMLSEWFCLHHDPIKLEALVAGHGAQGWDDRANPWASIAALPVLWAQGKWPAIEAALRAYPRNSTGWLVTPSLGWLGSALAENRPDRLGRHVAADQRLRLMSGLLELVAALAPSYWAQTPCRRLISGVLDVLAELPYLPDWCSNWYVELVVQAYGLCPDFWDEMRSRNLLQLHPIFARCAGSFMALQNALEHDKGAFLWEAARPFLLRKCAGHDMLRRVILSASSTPGAFSGRPDLTNLSPVLTQSEVEETALRWLTFPRSDAAREAIALRASEPLHKAACRGLRKAACDVARPAMTQTSTRLAADVHGALRQLNKEGTVTPTDAEQLTRLALATARAEAGFIGISALTALAETAARKDAWDLAQRWIAALAKHLDQSDAKLALRTHAPARALERFVSSCPDPALLEPLSRYVEELPIPGVLADEDHEAARLHNMANPFADTLVALISCRKNLETRARVCRETWGAALAKLGIPLITVVGKGEGDPVQCSPRFDGGLLELDAPDSYEGLPQKTLALAQWVLERTRFSRILKIDDDCLLDPEAYFNDPVFLTLPYYGRPLYRAHGSMDRGWHMSRSKTARGRMEFDKSPEPSRYADGSTGYLLSRPALKALAEVRHSPQGRRLEQVSFMEDKLVGDLLAQAGIAVAGPNYDVSIFRRTVKGLPPISQYESSFLPFVGSPVKLGHLDAGGNVMRQANTARSTVWPNPMKVWPSMLPAQTGWAKNALDLISPPERLEQARAAEVAVIAVMRNERFMLPHFLAHYRRLGVGAFLIVDNGSDDGTLEQLLAEADVSVFATDTPYRLSTYGVQWQEALMAQFRLGRWSLLADADELAFWQLPRQDGHVLGNLPELLSAPDFATATAVRLLMLDLYPRGPLSKARFDHSPFLEADHIDRHPLRTTWQGRGPWSNGVTLTSALRHRLMAELGTPARANLFVAQKYALLKYHPLMRLSAGLHYISGAKVAPRELAFAHFKYHAAFLAKAEEEVARGEHFNNAEEYRAYIALRAEARETLFHPTFSVPLAQCPKVQALCASYMASSLNSSGMISRPSSTSSAMSGARAGAIAKPILNPPLNT